MIRSFFLSHTLGHEIVNSTADSCVKVGIPKDMPGKIRNVNKPRKSTQVRVQLFFANLNVLQITWGVDIDKNVAG